MAGEDLRLQLEATADLLDGGATLGEVSARAGDGFRWLKAAIDKLVSETSPVTAPIPRALLAWAESVEARLSEQSAALWPADAHQEALKDSGRNSPDPDAAGSSESERGQSLRVGDAPAARTAPIMDATTAALERAGEALRAEQLLKAVRVVEAPSAADATAETCGKCKSTLECNGQWRTCQKCNQTWRVPERVRPLAQSAWVPDEPLGAHVFRDKGKPPEQSLPERIRELETEVARLDHANRERESTIGAQAGMLMSLRGDLRIREQRVAELEAEVTEKANMIEWRDAEIQRLRQANDARTLATRDARVRELEAEVERLKAGNATQAPCAASILAAVVALCDEWSDQLPDTPCDALVGLQAALGRNP